MLLRVAAGITWHVCRVHTEEHFDGACIGFKEVVGGSIGGLLHFSTYRGTIRAHHLKNSYGNQFLSYARYKHISLTQNFTLNPVVVARIAGCQYLST